MIDPQAHRQLWHTHSRWIANVEALVTEVAELQRLGYVDAAISLPALRKSTHSSPGSRIVFRCNPPKLSTRIA